MFNLIRWLRDLIEKEALEAEARLAEMNGVPFLPDYSKHYSAWLRLNDGDIKVRLPNSIRNTKEFPVIVEAIYPNETRVQVLIHVKPRRWTAGKIMHGPSVFKV